MLVGNKAILKEDRPEDTLMSDLQFQEVTGQSNSVTQMSLVAFEYFVTLIGRGHQNKISTVGPIKLQFC